MTDPPRRPGVYRAFRSDDVLLYVGSGDRFALRLSVHERKQPWFAQVAYITFEDCETRDQAYVVENDAIATEEPLYNKRLNFAEVDEPDQVGSSGLGLAPIIAAWLLGKWATRYVRWRLTAWQVAAAGHPVPTVANPFYEDSVATRMLTAVLADDEPVAC